MDTHDYHLDPDPVTGRNTRKVALTILALGIASAAVVFGSLAAWTATTANPGNSVTAGDLTLDEDTTAGYVFQATGVKPGDNNGAGEVVNISNSGSAALDLDLTKTMQAVPSDLDGELKLKILRDGACVFPASEVGACTAWGDWDGALSALDVGSLAAGGTAAFTFQWDFPVATATNDSKTDIASFDLAWNGIQS